MSRIRLALRLTVHRSTLRDPAVAEWQLGSQEWHGGSFTEIGRSCRVPYLQSVETPELER